MNSIVWYAVGLGGVGMLAIVVAGIIHWVPSACNVMRFSFLKYFAYLLLLERGEDYAGVSVLHTILILALIGGTVAATKIGVHNFHDLMIRSGKIASISLIPLFLGGRTSFIADKCRISLQTYYLAHHWIGRIAIVQGLLHSIIALASGLKPVSGLVVASSLTLILIFPLYIIPRSIFEIFIEFHPLIALVAIVTLLWHLFPGGEILFPATALTLTVLNRTSRFFLSRKSQDVQKKLIVTKGTTAVKLRVALSRPIRIRPGQYFYLRIKSDGLSRWERFQEHPFTVSWWDEPSLSDKSSGKSSTLVDENKNKGINPVVTSLSFLIQPQRGLSLKLIQPSSIQEVKLTGPYGQHLCLERYETVMLIAHDIGIAGILPYARHLLELKSGSNPIHRKALMTRVIDIYWILEDNLQDEWVADYLKELHAKKDFAQIWCYYPRGKPSKPQPEIDDRSYKSIYPSHYKSIPDAIKEVSGKSPGKSIVVVCGKPSVTKAIRGTVRKIMSKDNIIEFVEVEFQPRGSHKDPISKYLERRKETELQEFKKDPRKVLKKTPSQINTTEVQVMEFV